MGSRIIVDFKPESARSPPDDPLYDPRADLNGDGLVNQPDLGLLLADYGCGS